MRSALWRCAVCGGRGEPPDAHRATHSTSQRLPSAVLSAPHSPYRADSSTRRWFRSTRKPPDSPPLRKARHQGDHGTGFRPGFRNSLAAAQDHRGAVGARVYFTTTEAAAAAARVFDSTGPLSSSSVLASPNCAQIDARRPSNKDSSKTALPLAPSNSRSVLSTASL